MPTTSIPPMTAPALEPMRLANQTVYKMKVRLREDMPAGTIDDHLTIVTSDQRLPTMSLPVEGRVVPPLSVSPSPLFVGTLQPGQTATKQLVITGKEPFKVAVAAQDDEALQARLYQPIGQLKVELDWLKKKDGFPT